MLLLTPSVSGLFKWRQFEPEVILLAVGWYLRFSLSYREVEELLAEHVTVWRWVESERPEADCVARAREKGITVVVEPTAAATNLIETDDYALELIRAEISAATFEPWEKIWFMFMYRTAIEQFQGKPDLGLR